MKTSKPFSTISYNTAEFLKQKLDTQVQKRNISFYAFVEHYPEEDERKKHTHLIIVPNGQIQTDTLTDLLQELDPSNPLKPLGVMPWRSSKFGEWYLYSCHDVGYLASKNQSRAHHYQETDFVTSSEDYFHELITTIDRSKYVKTQEFVDRVLRGETFADMLSKGQIPAPQFNAWYGMYQYLKNCGAVVRNVPTHTPKVIDGEVIEE